MIASLEWRRYHKRSMTLPLESGQVWAGRNGMSILIDRSGEGWLVSVHEPNGDHSMSLLDDRELSGDLEAAKMVLYKGPALPAGWAPPANLLLAESAR